MQKRGVGGAHRRTGPAGQPGRAVGVVVVPMGDQDQLAPVPARPAGPGAPRRPGRGRRPRNPLRRRGRRAGRSWCRRASSDRGSARAARPPGPSPGARSRRSPRSPRPRRAGAGGRRSRTRVTCLVVPSSSAIVDRGGQVGEHRGGRRHDADGAGRAARRAARTGGATARDRPRWSAAGPPARPAGRRAKKNVSYRRVRPGGVIQFAHGRSSPASRAQPDAASAASRVRRRPSTSIRSSSDSPARGTTSCTPVSSNSSRAAATTRACADRSVTPRRSAHQDAGGPAQRVSETSSPGSTAPPGKAVMPPANAIPATRRSTKTSTPASESRTSRTVDARRTGTSGSPRPAVGCMTINLTLATVGRWPGTGRGWPTGWPSPPAAGMRRPPPSCWTRRARCWSTRHGTPTSWPGSPGTWPPAAPPSPPASPPTPITTTCSGTRASATRRGSRRRAPRRWPRPAATRSCRRWDPAGRRSWRTSWAG